MTHTTCRHVDTAAANAMCESFRRPAAAPALAPARPTFHFLPPHPSQHAASDRREPRRYEVRVGGVVVGEVRSRSRESWDLNATGRIRTRMRGYTRTWESYAPGETFRPASVRHTRADAAADLVNRHQ